MKTRLHAALAAALRDRLERVSRSARDSHAAATDPDSKAENKYDTRTLEASYLAAAQARQAMEFSHEVASIQSFPLPSFSMEDPIEPGALVEVDLSGESQWFLLVPAAGGFAFEWEGREVTLLTPAGSLYSRLIGLRAGDSLDDPPLFVSEVL